jgi:hypothetical protein
MRYVQGLTRLSPRYVQIWRTRGADGEGGLELPLLLYRHAYARVMTSFRSRIGGILSP